jgi:nucleotide-binding universal stress UspA family protein
MIEGNKVMPASRILLATDFDSASDAALTAGAQLAVTLEARVTVLSVLEALMYASPEMGGLAEKDPNTHVEATRKVTEAVERLRTSGVRDVSSAIEYGIAVEVICKHAHKDEYDLVVVGSHGRGTTVGDIIRKSAVPVMAVPADAPHGQAAGARAFGHLLVPTDFEEPAEQALSLALKLAARFRSKVTLVHAERPPSTAKGSRQTSPDFELNARTALDAAVAKAKATYENVDSLLSIGPRWERILEAATQTGADLIVMGTHGRAGLARVLLGSVAERVVQMSKVPVLTVSAPS